MNTYLNNSCISHLSAFISPPPPPPQNEKEMTFTIKQRGLFLTNWKDNIHEFGMLICNNINVQEMEQKNHNYSGDL